MTQLSPLRSLLLVRLETWMAQYGSKSWIDSNLILEVEQESHKILDLLTEMDDLTTGSTSTAIAELDEWTIAGVLEEFSAVWSEVAAEKRGHLPSLEIVEEKLIMIFEQTRKPPDDRDLSRFVATVAIHRLNALRSAFLGTLDGWLVDRRDQGVLDDDLLDQFDAAARGVLDLLSELPTCTDGLPLGGVGDLDENQIHLAFESFAKHWAEVEWRYQSKMPEPGLLEEKLVELEQLLHDEDDEADDLEEMVHELEVYLAQSGYPL